MDTRTDMYGLTITLTVADGKETYSRSDGVTVAFPVGAGWMRALHVLNAHAAAGWTPPESTEAAS